MMNIEFVGRGYSLDDRIRDYIEGKLGKMNKFLEEPIELRVTLEVEKHRQIADIHAAHKLGIVQAREEAADMYDAINAAVAKRAFMDNAERGGPTPQEALETENLPE